MRICKIFIVFLPFLFVYSCTYDREFAYLNDQVTELNRQVKNLQDSVDKRVGEELDNKLQTIHSQQASMRIELDRVKSKMAEINGRMEDNENLIKSMLDRDLKEKDEIKKALIDLSDRLARLEKMVNYQYEYLGLKRPQETPSTVSSGYEPPPENKSPEMGKLGEDQLYDLALNLYREGKYELSINRFQDFVKRFPSSDKADNAYFWIGECYMALNQYSQAILSYQKVIERYPKGNKVPSAMLRQAIAFLELKDVTPAKLLLKKIIKRHSKSPEAKIAKKKLRQLR